MKIYDKEIFRRNEVLKSTLLLLVTFLLGFAIGYIANIDKTYVRELEKNVQEQQNIIDNYKKNIDEGE